MTDKPLNCKGAKFYKILSYKFDKIDLVKIGCKISSWVMLFLKLLINLCLQQWIYVCYECVLR